MDIQTITKKTTTDSGVMVEETDFTVDDNGQVQTIALDTYFE